MRAAGAKSSHLELQAGGRGNAFKMAQVLNLKIHPQGHTSSNETILPKPHKQCQKLETMCSNALDSWGPFLFKP